MARAPQEYDDIPGTFVFDAERSRQGYGINMFCMSLMKDENRKAFKANEAEYLKRFKLTREQTEAVLKRDYNRMLELGGNIYFTAKLGATDGRSFQQLAAMMTGSSQEEYANMMLAGGRSGEGQPSASIAHHPVGDPRRVRPHHRQQDGGGSRTDRAAQSVVRLTERMAVPGDSACGQRGDVSAADRASLLHAGQGDPQGSRI